MDDNDDDGDLEMNREEHGDDGQQVEVPLVRQESSVKLVFRIFLDQGKISQKNIERNKIDVICRFSLIHMASTLFRSKIFCNFLFSSI